jgi:ABC-type nitrate/sulfonate/bicarbonate transport system substrate-binding protein
MKITFLWLLFVFASPSLLNRQDAYAQAPLQRARIGYASSGVNFADLFMARDKGFFEDEGLDAQLIQMSSNLAITAGISGELDGQASIASAMRAIQRGAP